MKQILCLGIVVLSLTHAYAQSDSTMPSPTNTFTIGTVYSNNANYYGQKGTENNPYIAFATTFRLKSGIYFTGLGYRLLHDTAHSISAGSVGIGSDFKLSKKLSADISYSHTFYPGFSPFVQAANPDNASIAFTHDGWLTTKLSGDYAFGKTNDFFATIGTGKQITLATFNHNDGITLSPAVDVTAGTQRFYQTYLTEKRLRDSLAGIILTPIFGPPANNTTKASVTTEFNLLSYNLKIPLAYSRARYLAQIDYQLSVLSNKAESGAGQTNSFFSASFYYQF